MHARRPDDNAAALPPCPRAPEAAAYVRDELSPAERRAFEEHGRVCDVCRELTADFGDVARVLRAPADAGLGAGFEERVLALARRQAAAPRRAWPRLLRAAAGIAAVAGAAAWWWHVCPDRADSVAAPPAPPVATVAPSRDEAIAQALDWLARTQEPSGAWNPTRWQGQDEYQVALTGMSLLAFLRRPAPAAAATDAGVVRRGLDFLLAQQGTNGAFGPACNGRMYNHGLATVAVLETYARTRDPRLEAPLAQAVRFIRDQQLDSGGWGYERRRGEAANTSISVWQIQALQLARAAGVAEATPTCQRGMRWLRGVIDGNGLFGYQRQGDFPYGSDTLTAMGAFCLFTAAGPTPAPAPEVARVGRALQTVAAKGGGEADFYRWFFLAQAFRAAGGVQFRPPLNDLLQALAAMRTRDGTFAGTWEPVGTWSAVGGRLYTTSMATLCLLAGGDPAAPGSGA